MSYERNLTFNLRIRGLSESEIMDTNPAVADYFRPLHSSRVAQ
jgi:hypothetical protein